MSALGGIAERSFCRVNRVVDEALRGKNSDLTGLRARGAPDAVAA